LSHTRPHRQAESVASEDGRRPSGLNLFKRVLAHLVVNLLRTCTAGVNVPPGADLAQTNDLPWDVAT
jgi:hypothetical protein